MKAKILVYVLPALILATIHLAAAQHQAQVHKIGWLGARSASAPAREVFLREFRALGHAERKLDRLPALVRQSYSHPSKN